MSPQECKIGMHVKYYPIKGSPEFRNTFIRSKPWQLKNGVWIVKVDGTVGGVCCKHLKKRKG